MRSLSLAIATLLCLSLTGCSSSAPIDNPSDPSPSPSASITPTQPSQSASGLTSNQSPVPSLSDLPESGVNEDGEYLGAQGFAFFDDPKKAFPTQIKHRFGTTTISKQPKTIVTLGEGSTDAVMMLARVPNGMPKVPESDHKGMLSDWASIVQGFGIEEGSPDWPVLLDTKKRVPVEEIERIKPDVILAPENGITESVYNQLSAIAPVVAPLHVEGTTPWQEVVEVTGQALGQGIHARELTKPADKGLSPEGKAFPEIAGKTIYVGTLRTTPTPAIFLYSPDNPRLTFYKDYGFKAAPLPVALRPGGQSQVAAIPFERASELKSDVMVLFVNSDQTAEQILADPLVQATPVAKEGKLILVTNKDERLATEALGLIWYTSGFQDHIKHIVSEINKQ